MSNVLNEQAKQQVIALGRLGWSLRRIQQETGVRRETASVYLKTAGIHVRPPGRRKQRAAKPAISVTTGSTAELASLNPKAKTLPDKARAEPISQETPRGRVSKTESSTIFSGHGVASPIAVSTSIAAKGRPSSSSRARHRKSKHRLYPTGKREWSMGRGCGAPVPQARSQRILLLCDKGLEGKIMAAGGFEHDATEAIIEKGNADLVAFGRHFLR